MASQKYIFNILFVVVAVCVLLCHASPVPEQGDASQREGRFYGGIGMANAQATAIANSGGYGGYPGGYGGFGGANAIAAASANAGAFGK